jgi:hypothetical protein
MWGDHFRGGSLIETGRVSSLEEGDLVGIVVDQGAVPLTPQIEVEYEVESQKFKIMVAKGTTIEQLRERLKYIHRGRGIYAIASEGSIIANEDSVEDWLQRTADIPLTAVLPKQVQVILDFRGTQKPLQIHDTATEKEFKALARPVLGLGSKISIAVDPSASQIGKSGQERRTGFQRPSR